MPTLRPSAYRPYSYGIVAADKPLNSNSIEVFPVEHLPMADGEITDNISPVKASGKDATGASYTAQAMMGNTITASWKPSADGNRMTAPDVRRGEPVMIYQFADSDLDFYWETMGNDLSKRKLETVVHGISATPNEDDPADETTSYVFGMSSHMLRIWMNTVKKNGEPCAWSFNLDTKNSIFQVQDDIGNKILINSQDHQVHLENADGSYLDLTRTIATIFAADQILAKTKAFEIDCETYTNNASTSITEETKQATRTAPENTVNGVTMQNGNMTVAGNFNTMAGSDGQTGNMVSSGNFETTGYLSATAGISTEGTVKASVIDGQTYLNYPT